MQQGATINGRVTAQDTGMGLDDVRVRFYDDNDIYLASTYVDAAGWYTETGLAAGNYRLEFDPFGDSENYLDEYYDDKPDLDSADVVSVTFGDVVAGIDAVLEQGSIISGTVTANDTGLPLDDINVSVYRLVEESYVDECGEFVAALFALPLQTQPIPAEPTR